MNKSKIDYFVDMIALVSFLVTAITGLVIMIFLPPSEGRGGVHNYLFGYGRHDWGAIHDLAGVIMIIAVLIHLVLHWRWIVNMTKGLFKKEEKCQKD
jgi:hypothetical protein